MDTVTIAKICAGFAVVVTIGWGVFGYFGLTTLREIRDELRARRAH